MRDVWLNWLIGPNPIGGFKLKVCINYQGFVTYHPAKVACTEKNWIYKSGKRSGSGLGPRLPVWRVQIAGFDLIFRPHFRILRENSVSVSDCSPEYSRFTRHYGPQFPVFRVLRRFKCPELELELIQTQMAQPLGVNYGYGPKRIPPERKTGTVRNSYSPYQGSVP